MHKSFTHSCIKVLYRSWDSSVDIVTRMLPDLAGIHVKFPAETTEVFS